MAEFLVGLVCIMLLVAGLQQIAFLSEKGFASFTNTRHAMALQYTEDPPSEWNIFNFGAQSQPGVDAKNYTADDRRVNGNDRFYQDSDGYLNKLWSDEIDGYLITGGSDVVHNDLKFSEGTFSTTAALNMMYTADRQAVTVVPFLDKILGRDQIMIRTDLWMPRWDEIP
jgi:hypothetical protein